MTTRREFIKNSVLVTGGAALFGGSTMCGGKSPLPRQGLVISAAADDMLIKRDYNPDAVHRAFQAGLTELTGENNLEKAWSSLVSPEDVVGIKINGIAAPKISSSIQSIHETVAGLKSAGVKENNIIIWDHMDRAFQRTGLDINRGPTGIRVHGSSDKSAVTIPWTEGFDRDVYISLEDGTHRKFRRLMERNFVEDGTHREIFNSCAWLWMLINLRNEKAQKYREDIRRLYMDYNDREGIKKIAEDVADEFDDVVIEDEEKSFFSNIVTRDITKLINIAVLKHNEDSGVTWAAKNIALGVTTNKVRFHLDYCATAIPMIMNHPCIKEKTVLHIGEAAKISTVSVAGAQMAFDNRIFFSRDPVAMDRIGLDILEEKRREMGLESIRDIATHVEACGRMGVGISDLDRIEWRALQV